MLDLDHFKTINDTLGHSAGDELIVRVAHALRSRLRESDVLARLGGDEFAILLPEATPEEADAVAAAVLDAVRTLAVPTATGRTRTVTASLGIALFDSAEQLTGEDVLVNADLAMYDAKESGRDQLAAYDAPERPETRIEARISWADMIRDALAEDALRAARAADRRPRHRRGDPVRAAAAHARRRRRADPARPRSSPSPSAST